MLNYVHLIAKINQKGYKLLGLCSELEIPRDRPKQWSKGEISEEELQKICQKLQVTPAEIGFSETDNFSTEQKTKTIGVSKATKRNKEAKKPQMLINQTGIDTIQQPTEQHATLAESIKTEKTPATKKVTEKTSTPVAIIDDIIVKMNQLKSLSKTSQSEPKSKAHQKLIKMINEMPEDKVQQLIKITEVITK